MQPVFQKTFIGQRVQYIRADATVNTYTNTKKKKHTALQQVHRKQVSPLYEGNTFAAET